MNKAYISALLRTLKLIYIIDYLRFYYQRFKSRKINQSFKKNNPGLVLPPDYIIYESFNCNYEVFYTQSVDTAKWVISFFEKYTELRQKKILDWGCGPARVIRHFPGLLNEGCEFFGTDYNKRSIDWCKKNIPGVQFTLNGIAPPLAYEDSYFDLIYSISVLTHLSAEMHQRWFNELYRVCKQGGIMYLTTQGDAFKTKLTKAEIKRFEAGELVIRSKTKEGHRTFSAFQPEGYMKKLLLGVEILEHVKRKPDNNNIHQDIWIIRKL